MQPWGPRLVTLVVGVALLAACSGTPSGPVASVSGASRPTPTSGTAFDVAVPAAVANLPLVDQSGRVVTLASLKGKTVVLADFLTLCQEICPLTSANLRLVDDAVSRAGLSGSVQILEVTVDPGRDSPARLTAYQKLFGARPGWSFVTGTTPQLAALWKQFGVPFERTPEPAGDAPSAWLTGRPAAGVLERRRFGERVSPGRSVLDARGRRTGDRLRDRAPGGLATIEVLRSPW